MTKALPVPCPERTLTERLFNCVEYLDGEKRML